MMSCKIHWSYSAKAERAEVMRDEHYTKALSNVANVSFCVQKLDSKGKVLSELPWDC